MAEAGDEADIWTAITKIRIALLTTQEDGRLVSRPMASLARPEDGRIYFVTRMDAKVGEIGGSAPVNLGYSDPHKSTYVTISGTAHTSQDRARAVLSLPMGCSSFVWPARVRPLVSARHHHLDDSQVQPQPGAERPRTASRPTAPDAPAVVARARRCALGSLRPYRLGQSG